ncbi:MAG TPA: RHS repeat-associated core domain-containing protein [Candidatus Acidoferrum sp.]|nr:RHS repeat-associated core domain-containing protein [Candidatus Acidoferrum sp.]
MALNTKMFRVFQNCNHLTEVCNDYWLKNSVTQYPYPLGISIRNTNLLGPYWTYNATYGYVYSTTTWDGAVHQMAYNTATSTAYETTDNTGIWNDGTRVSPHTFGIAKRRNGDLQYQDTNGNYISSTSDTIGRTSSTGISTSDYTGCGGPVGQIISAGIGYYPAPNGTSTQVKVCNTSTSLKTNFHANNVDMLGNQYIKEYTGSTNMIQSVVVYDGASWATSPAWTFEYNDRDSTDTSDINYGSLTKITFPTGGSVSYAYKTYFLCDAYSDSMLNPANRGVISRTVNANDGTGPQITTYTNGIVKDPQGNESVHTFTGLGSSCSFFETNTQYYQGTVATGTLLKSVQTDYSYIPNHADVVGDGAPSVVNVLPIHIITTINGKVSKIEKDYDSNLHLNFHGVFTESYGNVMEMREYDFGTGAPGALLRKTDYTYKAFDTASYLTANIIDKVSSVTVYDGGGTQVSKTTYGFDEYSLQPSGVTTNFTPPVAGTPRGNQTSVKKWLNTTGGTLNTTTTYYDTGMPYQVTDPRGNVTTYSYSPTYAGAYVTQTTMPATGSVSHVVSGTYDFNTGKIATFTDQNNQVFHYYYDSLWRMTSGTFPDNGQTIFNYPDLVTIETKKQIDSTRWTDAYVRFDGLGRPIRHISANGEATPWDQVDTCYDVLGNKHFVTYPYQGNGLSDSQCTKPGDTFTYDALGRVLTVTHSDSSVATTAYTGRAASVSDEGNGTRSLQRVSQIDGLGRLASVCEVSSITLTVGLTPAPASCGQDVTATGFLTTYSYDALGNLKTVIQGGLNQRSFNYDSLSRLTSATNPESGTTIYKYDVDTNCTGPNSFSGQLVSKTDARGVRTCMQYDALNRLTQKNYSDGITPTALLSYDSSSVTMGTNNFSVSNTVGRLSSACMTSACNVMEAFSYDPMGRVAFEHQCTPANCSGASNWLTTYGYDLAGDMTSSTNGAGVTLTYSANTAQRLMQLTSSLSDANHPGTLLQNAHYGAFGMVSEQLGSGINDSIGYAPRGWLQSLSSTSGGTTRYSFGLTFAPNGNVLTGNDSVNGNWTYTYDDFNRLLTANATSQAYSYVYDRFGNRWQQNGPHAKSLSFDANNRIPSGTGITYDLAGNVTGDGTHTYTYDGEGRVIWVDGGSTAQYMYDAQGKRVRKITSTSTVDYIYDASGSQIAEFSSTGTWNRGEVYASGRHIATYSGGTSGTMYFNHDDWLGTERARTDKAGNSYETCTSLPFGDWQSCTGSDPSPLHFTGKERDSESGLDDFGARYYSSPMGRFASVDPIWVKIDRLVDPQRLNLYAYGRNNPLVFVDPDGEDVKIGRCSIGSAQDCFNQLQAGLTKEDREHVKLVSGDGTNGCDKGSSCVVVDADYKSDSKNFQVLQTLANDHSATASVDVLKPNDSFDLKTVVSFDRKTGERLGILSTTPGNPNEGTGFSGYTFFPYQKGNAGPYSPDDTTHAVANTVSDSLAATIHHELRHVFLGDFGRSVKKAEHGQPGVNQQTKAAEDEAKKNQNQ